MSSSNGEPNKTTGHYHSVKGTTIEAIGNMSGSESWQQSGQQEHAQGEAEYKAAQAKGYADGTKDRVGGKVDTVMGAITGDRQQELSGNARHDKGATQQEFNKNA